MKYDAENWEVEDLSKNVRKKEDRASLNCDYQIAIKFDENLLKSVLKSRTFRKFEWSTWKMLDCRILLQILQIPCRDVRDSPNPLLGIPAYGPEMSTSNWRCAALCFAKARSKQFLLLSNFTTNASMTGFQIRTSTMKKMCMI